jgi:large subunit ribosomal protein L7/L12
MHMSEETKTTPEAVEETAAEATEEQAAPEAEAEAPAEEAAPEAAEETQEAPAEEASSDDSSDDEGEDVEVPAEFAALVEQVENMSVLELHSLVKLLEKKFGVSAAAVAVAGGAGAGEAAAEKDEFDVVLTSDGGAKIPVMKVVKEVLGLGLKEAKDFVENLPANVKEGLKKEEAEEIKAKIEEAGGKVELK